MIVAESILAITSGKTNAALPEHRADKALVAAATKSTADGIYDNVKSMLPSRAPTMRKPTWHAPWKLYRCVARDPRRTQHSVVAA